MDFNRRMRSSNVQGFASAVSTLYEEEEEWEEEKIEIGYLVVFCSLVLNKRVFYSNCKLFQYYLNFVECYYFVNIHFHMVYFDFETFLN